MGEGCEHELGTGLAGQTLPRCSSMTKSWKEIACMQPEACSWLRQRRHAGRRSDDIEQGWWSRRSARDARKRDDDMHHIIWQCRANTVEIIDKTQHLVQKANTSQRHIGMFLAQEAGTTILRATTSGWRCSETKSAAAVEHHSVTAPYGDRPQPPGLWRRGTRTSTTRQGDRSPLLPSRSSSSCTRRSPVGAGQHLCLRSLADSHGSGADHRDLRTCADDRCCAAVGGPACGRPQVLRHVFVCGCRAGDRSARIHPTANSGSRAAAGGTVVGSANSPVFVEQTVDIPVQGGVKRARGGLQGSVPGQSSTASSHETTTCTTTTTAGTVPWASCSRSSRFPSSAGSNS